MCLHNGLLDRKVALRVGKCMGDETRQGVEHKVERVQRRYEGHGKVFRVLWVLAAITVVLAGLAMTVFPGPAVVVIPLGLAMLAVEFAWARRLLIVGMERSVEVKDRLQDASVRTNVLAGAAVACLVAAVIALIVLQ
jgi:uncharacterized protein (TIGR02611 family)